MMGLVALLSVGALVGSACAEDEVAAPETSATAAPAATDAPAETTVPAEYVPPQGDIIGEALVAANVPELAGQFSTLAGYLIHTNLVAPLQAPNGPYTVFAPVNRAFDPLAEAGIIDLAFEDDAAVLTQVLTYHVVAGAYAPADLEDGMELETLQGETVVIGVDGDTITVNGNEVAAAGVPATNGYIYVMTDVLVPPSIAAALG
jgi:uncharacterized surface protein with fasciclin (FAS1) repeats